MCKRVFSLLLALVMVLGIANFSTYASAMPLLSIENKSVNVGESFTIAITLNNVESVYGGNFTLQYDNSLLTVESSDFGSIVSEHTKNCNLDYQSAGNLIRVTFSGAKSLSDDGTLITFKFKAKENVSGIAELTFTAYKMYDENGSSVSVDVSGGSVIIEENILPTVTPTATPTVAPEIVPAIAITGGTVTSGKEITVSVDISNVDNVYGGNFTLQYDNSLLTVESSNFGSIVSEHTKNCNLDYQSAGNLIRVTFSGAKSLSNDGTLITFTFKAKENVSGTAELTFTAHKMYDENGSSVSVDISDGNIVIEIADTKPILYGDADGSGTVDAIDAMVVLQRDVELIGDNQIELNAADVDGDGTVNAIDAMLILQYDVELIESFPVENMRN